MITVRRARPGDALAIRNLLKDLGYGGDARATDETVSQVVKHPEAAVFVATQGVEVVGYVALSCRPQMRLAGLLASIDEIAVTQSQRQTGVGTQLLETAIGHARSLQCRRIEVREARPGEGHLRRFFSARNFVELDEAVLGIEL